MESIIMKHLQEYIEEKKYMQYFKVLDEAIYTLTEAKRWRAIIEIVLQAVTIHLSLNNKLAAIKLLTDYSLLLANYGSIEQKINYYLSLAVTYEGDDREENVLAYLKKAQTLAEESNMTTTLPQIYYQLSIYYEKIDMEKSMDYGHKSIALKRTVSGQLHYLKLLMAHHYLSTVEVKLEEAEQYFKETPITSDTIVFWRLQAQYLRMREQVDKAYTYLKERLSDVADNSKWCELLYEDICAISKQHYEADTYIEDLKAALKTKKLVLQIENSEQLQLLDSSFNDATMKRMAWTDPLTGLPNRRYLEDTYDQMEVPFSAFMFDIDHFKSINDQYGHLDGDQVLQELVAAINTVLEPYKAQFVRLGGDEFFSMIPIRFDQTKVLAQALVEAVRKVRVEALAPTISIGLCHVERPMPLDAVIQYVDEALYEAKRNGRNQFVLRNEVLR